MWNISNRPLKVVLNKRLDEDIRKIVQSFNIMVSVFFSSKYRIKDSNITPYDKKKSILLFISIMLCNLLYLYLTISDDKSSYVAEALNTAEERIMFWIYFSLIFLLLLFCNSFHGQTHIFLILRIQEIHRNIKMQNCIQSYVIWNWISLLTTVCSFVLLVATYSGLFLLISFADICIYSNIIAQNFNSVYCFRLMALLTKYLEQ